MHKALKALFLTLLPVWVIYSCSVGLQDENTTVVMAYSLSLSHVELTACIRCFPNFGPGNQTMCFWKLRVHMNLHHMTWSYQNGSINVVVVLLLPSQQQPVLVDLATIKSISNSICCYYGIYIRRMHSSPLTTWLRGWSPMRKMVTHLRLPAIWLVLVLTKSKSKVVPSFDNFLLCTWNYFLSMPGNTSAVTMETTVTIFLS